MHACSMVFSNNCSNKTFDRYNKKFVACSMHGVQNHATSHYVG
uniref:Uncharacterized protein n=1 Tax=Arundo donax TaxID=35708 RepID=A0A0A8YKN8_ARUDO